MFSKRFLVDAVERAIKTGAQFVIAAVFASETGPVNAFELDWASGAGVFVGGAVLSLLTSIASTAQGNSISPASVAPPV